MGLRELYERRIRHLEIELADLKDGLRAMMGLQQHLAKHIRNLQVHVVAIEEGLQGEVVLDLDPGQEIHLGQPLGRE